jgi:hypothetical protein
MLCYYTEWHYAAFPILFTIILSVIMLSVFILNVIMLNIIMLNVVILNVIMLSVVAPNLPHSARLYRLVDGLAP